jgi:hypothetical protein
MAPDSGGTVLSRDEVDRALARLGAEHEAIESSLLALQDHAGRRLLEGAELSGTTRRRWERAERTVTTLWSYFDTCTEALTTAQELRAKRRNPSRDDLLQLLETRRAVRTSLFNSRICHDRESLRPSVPNIKATA